MSHRKFTDGSGRYWDAWVVIPTKGERRLRPDAGTRVQVERRRRDEYRAPLGPHFANGWLCFQTGAEKRRLGPFPSDWESLSDAELSELCQRATPAVGAS